LVPRYYESLEFVHTETLLDVVFGVVIGLALTKLPGHVRATMTDPRPEVACPLLLLLSALIFSAFYWLEVRHFMNAQKNFNEAISDAGRALDDAVPLPLATFLLGVLLMMTLATGILKFADEGLFRAFVLANLLFWLCDLGGTIILKRSYVRFEKEIRKVMEEHRADHAWFVGHIVSRFFYLYSGGNALIFAVFLAADHWTDGSIVFRVATAGGLVAVTLLRHLLWRSRAYSWWLQRALKLR
jgi:hypothetical protein